MPLHQHRIAGRSVAKNQRMQMPNIYIFIRSKRAASKKTKKQQTLTKQTSIDAPLHNFDHGIVSY